MKYFNGIKSLSIRRARVLTVLFFLTTLLIVVIFSIRPAWPMEFNRTSAAVSVADYEMPLAPSQSAIDEDSCLPLLKSIHHINPPSSSMGRNRRSAGEVAAIGLVFGVRFALGPKELTKSGRKRKAIEIDFWQPRGEGGVQALAIAEYRRCKNENALKLLSDWR